MNCPFTNKICNKAACSSAFKCSRMAFCSASNSTSGSSKTSFVPEIESIKDASPCDSCRSPLKKCELLCKYCAKVQNLSKLSYFEVFFGCDLALAGSTTTSPSATEVHSGGEIGSSFDLDTGRLQKKYYALQQKYHPDRFPNKDSSKPSPSTDTQEASAEISSFLSRAYSTLKDPFQRAVYMLTLNGIDFNVEDDSQIQKAVDFEFLSEIFEKKEQLESRENASKIFADAKQQLLELQSTFKKLFASSKFDECLAVVVRWKYQKSLYDSAAEILSSGD